MNVRRSLGISGLAEIATFLFSLLSAIVVSRLLRPDEIGVFSVAVSVIAFAHILREFGVGQYLVQLHEVTRRHLRAIFTVMLLISWSMAALLFILKDPLAAFYAHAGIAQVLALLAINFVVLPFGSPILALLKRQMEFGKVAAVSLTSTCVQVTVTITTAWAGESYLSMAWGSIAGNLTTVTLLSLLRPEYALLLPTRKGLCEVLGFGSKSSITYIVAELGAGGPDLILGRTLGFDAVAFFSRAASLTNMVIAKFVGVFRQVYFPALAQGVREGGNAAELYYRSTSLLVGIIAPLIAVLTLLADFLILFLFGEQWQKSASLAIVLCAAEIFRTPTLLAAPTLIACGHISAVMRCQIFIQAFFLFLLCLSIWLPLEHLVYCLILARIYEMLVYLQALNRNFGVTLSRFWLSSWKSYFLVPFAAAGPVLLRNFTQPDQFGIPIALFLLLSGLLGTIGLLLGIFITQHSLQEEIYRLLPSSVRRKAGKLFKTTQKDTKLPIL
jgi:O-antigen/teichoic acid export membrane protein